MTHQLSQPIDKSIDAELDRLTYSAYLLTLDPGLALSVVMSALDDSLGDSAAGASLLGRTVGLSLQQLQREPNSRWDRESSAAEVLLYSDYKVPGLSRILRMTEDAGNNAILTLKSGSRIAFVLHHILGYAIREAATMAQMTEKGYRAHLRNAYLQLASPNLIFRDLDSTAVGDSGSA
jgi:hypothetical protein